MKQIIVLVRITTKPFTIKHDNDCYYETMMMTTVAAAAETALAMSICLCVSFAAFFTEKE